MNKLLKPAALIATLAAAFAVQATSANAFLLGLPPPSPSNLHTCSHFQDELHPWKESNEETGTTIWSTWYAYDWWGKNGSCPQARFLAEEAVGRGAPTATYDVISGTTAPCVAIRKENKNTFEPFQTMACHVKAKAKKHPKRRSQDFGVLIVAYPVLIDGWFRNPGHTSCTDPTSCPGGPQGIPERLPDEVDTICGLQHGTLVCHVSNNPGAGGRMTLTLSRHGKKLDDKAVTFTDAQVLTVKLRGAKPLNRGVYQLHVVVVYQGRKLTDTIETLVLG
jgi:hypothetical protein